MLPPARACVPSHHRCTRSGVCLGEASGKRRAQPTSARLRHATVDIIQWAAAGARSLRTTACYSQPHSTLALSLEGESFHCFWASANAKKAHVDAHTQHPGARNKRTLETSAHSNKRTEPRKEASRARHERTNQERQIREELTPTLTHERTRGSREQEGASPHAPRLHSPRRTLVAHAGHGSARVPPASGT